MSRRSAEGGPLGFHRPGSRPGPGCSCGLLHMGTQAIETYPLDPIAEALARLVSRAELDEERSQQSRHLSDRNVGRKHTVEPRAVEIAAQHHAVLAKRGADEADVAKVRTRASVGAAAHSKADAFLGQAQLLEQAGQLPHPARTRTPPSAAPH